MKTRAFFEDLFLDVEVCFGMVMVEWFGALLWGWMGRESLCIKPDIQFISRPASLRARKEIDLASSDFEQNWLR